MAGGIIFLLFLGIIAAWIWAGIKAHRLRKSEGVLKYFVQLILSFVCVFVLWLIIVYPTQGCSGLLCGLGEVVIWLLSSGVLLLLWPLFFTLYISRNWPAGEVKVRKNEELLDNEFE